jgi:hypothetical protein
VPHQCWSPHWWSMNICLRLQYHSHSFWIFCYFLGLYVLRINFCVAATWWERAFQNSKSVISLINVWL